MIVYFFAQSLAVGFFVTTANGDKFYSRLWLSSEILTILAGFATYILIIIVAKEMYVYYQDGLKRANTYDESMLEDINARIIDLQNQITEEAGEAKNKPSSKRIRDSIQSEIYETDDDFKSSSSGDEDNEKAFKAAKDTMMS